jgi:altronate dehydratase
VSDSARRIVAAVIDARDDVATALGAIDAGSEVTLGGVGAGAMRAVDAIASGHKLALHAIARGAPVRKYGEVIGRATKDIAAGEWVHVHNLESDAPR